MERKTLADRIRATLHHRVLFIRTFGMMTGLSLITALVFAVFLNQITVKNQRRNIDNLNLYQLERVSSSVELTFDLMANGMSRSLWADDFMNLMIRQDVRTEETSYRVIRSLKDSVEENDLVRKAYFYLPGPEEVYLYTGTHIPLEELGDAEMIRNYLAVRGEGRDPEKISEWRLMMMNRRIFLATDFCLPAFVGVLFYEIDRTGLYDIIQMENSDFNTTIFVTDSDGTLLFDYMSSGPQKEDLQNPALFTTPKEAHSGALFYRYQSDRLGWNYFIRTSSGSGASISSLVSLIMSFLIIYLLCSLVFTWLITRSVYEPINRLLRLIADPGTGRRDGAGVRPEQPKDEADYLALAYQDSFGKNEKYLQLMKGVSDDVLEQQIRNILTGHEINMDQLSQILEIVERPELKSGYYAVLVGELEYTGSETPSIVEKEICQKSLLKTFRESGEARYRICVCAIGMTQAAAVYCFPKDVSVLQIREKLQAVQETIRSQSSELPYLLETGSGNVCDELPALQYSYYEALEKIRYARYMAENTSAEPAQDHGDSMFYMTRYRRILDLADQGNAEMAAEEEKWLLNELENAAAPDPAVFTVLEDHAMEYLISHRISQEEIRKAGIDRGDQTQDLGAFFRFTETVIRLLDENSRKSHNRYISDAKEYIAQHYTDGKLGLNDISDAMGISYSYLSTIFTEGTGEGLIAYLNRYRIEQAKRFLVETRLNISEIGYKCGFNSVQSFGRVFRKYQGMSPKQYRESLPDSPAGKEADHEKTL